MGLRAYPGQCLLLVAAVLAMSVSARVSAQESAEPSTGNAAESNYDLNKNTAPNLRNPVDLRQLPSDMDLLFPLAPEEKVELRERNLEDEEATYRPLRDVKPLRELVQISGNADRIPEIKVTPDYPTSIVFTDITGAPWPINYIAQTNALAAIEQPSGTENSIVIFANNAAGRKSASIFLEGLTLPVTVTISGNPSEYHALKHIRITERGPNSQETDLLRASGRSNDANNLNVMSGDSDDNSGKLDRVLNRLAYKVTPEGFTRLKTSDPNVDAWIEDSEPRYMYLMTDYNVVAPAPRAGARSVTPLQDGVRIYIIPRINPVMALNSQGARVYLRFAE